MVSLLVLVKMTVLSCLNERGMEFFNCQSGWRDELDMGASGWTASGPRETHRAERDRDWDLKRGRISGTIDC